MLQVALQSDILRRWWVLSTGVLLSLILLALAMHSLTGVPVTIQKADPHPPQQADPHPHGGHPPATSAQRNRPRAISTSEKPSYDLRSSYVFLPCFTLAMIFIVAWPRATSVTTLLCLLGSYWVSLLAFDLAQRQSPIAVFSRLVLGTAMLALAMGWHRPKSRHNSQADSGLSLRVNPVTSAFRAFDELTEEAPAEERKYLQRQERWYDAEGCDCIQGSLEVQIPANCTLWTAHVGFIPPFSDTPQVTFECHSDSPVKVSLTQALWHGATFEIILREALPHATSVAIEYFAQEKTELSSSA